MHILLFFKQMMQWLSTNVKKWFIVIFLLLIVLPAAAMIYLYYLKSSAVIEEEVTRSTLQTLKQSSINLSNILDTVEDASEKVMLNKEVMEFIGDKSNDDVALQVSQVKSMRNLFSSFQSKGVVDRIRLFIDGGKLAAGERVNFFPVQDLSGRGWYGNVVEKKGGIFWTGVYREDYIDTGSHYVVSCARVLKHSHNYNQNDGVLLVDISESKIYGLLSTIEKSPGEKIYLIDRSGKTISYADKSMLGKVIVSPEELEEMGSGASGTFRTDKDGRSINVVYRTIPDTGWKLVDEVDRRELVKSSLIFSNISLFILAVALLILFSLSIFVLFLNIMDQLNRKAKSLTIEIEKEGIGAIDAGNDARNSEFTKLESSVSRMIGTVKSLMEESYRSKLRERDAQLTALQAQINPHFLYNTLDTINWMLVKINAKDASSMIDSLARYFRLSLSKGRTVVQIRDELELVRVYLVLQQTSYKGAIRFEIRADEELLDCGMLKLTLQPIVENAVLHGILKKATRSGFVKIEAERDGEDVRISVTDDGVGMDPEKIGRVLTEPPAESNGHYGLYNVNERVRLYYGEEYGVRIFSEPGKGTRVELRIKKCP